MRREVSDAVHERDGHCYLDLAYIKNSCPILASTMQEAFRYNSIGMTVRSVVEDHMLAGKYLLKKYVVVPSTTKLRARLADSVVCQGETSFLSPP